VKLPISLLSLFSLPLVAVGAPVDGAAIRYHLSRAGDVSLAVYDRQGVLVREVLRASPQAAGDHVARWDGRGRDHSLLPDGDYQWRLLETSGLHAEYLLSVGSNYPIGTNLSSSGGPGTHLAPFAVAADPTAVYVGAFQTENIESALVKVSRDGRTRLWSQHLPADAQGQEIVWEGGRSLAVDGEEVYLLGHHVPQRVHVSDARTGKPLRALSVDWAPPLPQLSGLEAQGGATAMAVAGGVLVVAYQAHDAVSWFDARTGAHLASARIPSPAGVAVDGRGTVFVATGDRVVRLTRERPRPIALPGRLVKPGALAVDAATGELLVFEGGERQQIARLSRGGEVVRRHGAPGGRREGLYVPTDFRDVTALASDGAGGFLAAEPYAAPRRVGHFDRDGRLVREWYGGQPWDTGAAIEPGRPEAIWIASATGLDGAHWIMRVLVDYASRSWRVHSCYRYLSPESPQMRGSGNEGNLFHIYRHGGTNYLAVEAVPSIWRIDEASWRLLPATALNGAVQWNDVDGDGQPQASESTPFVFHLRHTFQIPHLAENFDFFFVSKASEPCRIRRIRVTSWTPSGAPVYGGDPDGEVVADCPARFTSNGYLDPRWSVFMHLDAATGSLYGAFNAGTTDWCTSRDSFVEAWDDAGRSRWQVGEQGPARTTTHAGLGYAPTAPGLIYWNLRGIAGVTHDCLVAFDVDGGWNSERAQTYVWDRDGLFVGGLFDHPQLVGTPEFMYHLGGELAHGTLYTSAEGEVIFAGNWESEVRLYRITGWETPGAPWVRMSGALSLSRAGAAAPRP
jgi:hypothetical protein